MISSTIGNLQKWVIKKYTCGYHQNQYALNILDLR